MSKILNIEDIDEKFKNKVYQQDYTPQKNIEGVKVVAVKNFLSEEGDFSEICRIANGELELFPGFRLEQINRTRLFPNSIKAWHIHFKQDEVWYLPPAYDMLVGLWDLRKDSATCGETMRIVLGGGQSKMLFIPKGVAHGSACFSPKEIELFYFVNEQFNPNDPDEKRIPWDTLGEDFWKPQRD